ncbi:hypothetical protein I4U23_015276 [Adineta vaga]|nr:hypothetical protein I4U23_015276 [Adineta vaga]
MASFSSRAINQIVGQSPLAEQPADNNKSTTESTTNEKTIASGFMSHGASGLSSTNQKPKGNICPRCGKPVYFAEEVKAVGQSFHKLCYRCANCKKSINGANFSEHDGNLYDNNCYQRLFGPKGVGFGIGAGALSTGN